MAAYVLTRYGSLAVRVVQVALVLTALIALFYAVGAPQYGGG